MPIKRALLVGLNYKGTQYELRGCENDVMAMNEVLVSRFGFTDATQRRVLTGNSGTTQEILLRLNWLVNGLQAGDTAFFHFSGHGTQCPVTDYENNQEPDGLDEVIVPVDMDWRRNIIKDNDFRQIFSRVPKDVNLIVILDNCHSGTGLRAIDNMPMPNEIRELLFGPVRNRYLPPPIDIAQRAVGLELTSRERGLTLDVAEEQNGILISGCASHQTSADAWIQQERKFMGACTYHLLNVLKNRNYNVSYNDLIQELVSNISTSGYEQRPELSGKSELFQRKFLC